MIRVIRVRSSRRVLERARKFEISFRSEGTRRGSGVRRQILSHVFNLILADNYYGGDCPSRPRVIHFYIELGERLGMELE